jgi:hypothetical protein
MYFHRKYDTVSFVTSRKQKDRVAELRLPHLPTWWHVFDLTSVGMRIVLDDIAVELGLLQILSVSFPPVLHTHLRLHADPKRKTKQRILATYIPLFPSSKGECLFYIPIYIQQDVTLRSLFNLQTSLHVSGGSWTHHQERIQLYLQNLVLVTPLLLPAAIALLMMGGGTTRNM